MYGGVLGARWCTVVYGGVWWCMMVCGGICLQDGVWWCNHPSTCGGIGVADWCRGAHWHRRRWCKSWRVEGDVSLEVEGDDVSCVCGGVGGTQPNFYLFITDFQYRDCQKHVSDCTTQGGLCRKK